MFDGLALLRVQGVEIGGGHTGETTQEAGGDTIPVSCFVRNRLDGRIWPAKGSRRRGRRRRHPSRGSLEGERQDLGILAPCPRGNMKGVVGVGDQL